MAESCSKQKYRGLCATEASIPIFSRDWWLDAVCDNAAWDASVVEQAGSVGVMPYCISKRGVFRLLTQPKLTQTLGPWFRLSTAKYAKALAQQKDVMEALIDQLPQFDHFSQNWHYTQTNWLPFHWRGFKQTTYYTYVLPDLRDETNLWSGLLENIRREIRKASNRYNLYVTNDVNISDFLALNRMTFSRQGKTATYSESLVRRLDAVCAARACRRILVAKDAEGRIHAGTYIVWDENSAYYLMGGADPQLRNSGAGSLCMWEAIKHAATVTKQFNFEGSMIEAIERFFRAFGAIQVPYFNLTKTPSRLLRIRECLLSITREGRHEK